MIKFHPTDTHLVNFTEGTLSSVESLLVSAHCDMCKDCKHKVDMFTENIASQVFSAESDKHVSIQREFISMFECITNKKPVSGTHQSFDNFEPKLALEGRQFTLPPTLSRFVDRMGEWSHLVGKLWQAQVEIGGGKLAQFIYMEKGGSVPEHTHQGNEFTLVIDGKFSDGAQEYNIGDYIALNENHTHAPTSHVDEGCLVFSVIDKPLYFTSGWAKLINPLSQLYFKVNT